MSILRAAGSATGLAGGGQEVLLQAAGRLGGAQVAAHPFPAADTGAETAASVPWPTRQALEQREDYMV